MEARESYAAALIAGVQAYQAEHPEFAVVTSALDLARRTAADERFDGIIASPSADRSLGWLRRRRLPTVIAGWREHEHDYPVVSNDDTQAGEKAAEFLGERGYRHFAFVGFRRRFAAERSNGFVRGLGAGAGERCAMFELDPRFPPAAPARKFGEWLRQLPLPIGIAAADDRVGRWVVENCRRNGIDVPSVAAVVGIGNNLVECALSAPSLSSVSFDLPALGRRAAETLHRVLQGRPVDRFVTVPPRGVEARGSTDVVAYSDPRLNRVLSFLRRRALGPLTIEDVLREFPMSRKTLFNLFRGALGRTAHEEIVRLRLTEAESLLRRTDLPLHRIAEAAGFGEERRMARAFRAYHQKTPREFRAASRGQT